MSNKMNENEMHHFTTDMLCVRAQLLRPVLIPDARGSTGCVVNGTSCLNYIPHRVLFNNWSCLLSFSVALLKRRGRFKKNGQVKVAEATNPDF